MAQINVTEELREHYERIIETRDIILSSAEYSGAEKASIINATTQALKELVKLQSIAYSADLVWELVEAIIKSLEKEAPDVIKRVIEVMEKHFAEIS